MNVTDFNREGKIVSLVRTPNTRIACKLTRELESQGFIRIEQYVESIIFKNTLFTKPYEKYENNSNLPGIVVNLCPVRNQIEWLHSLAIDISNIRERFPIPLVVISTVELKDSYGLCSGGTKEYLG